MCTKLREFLSGFYLCFLCFQTVDVQPNDGFGTLLPLESFDVDIMFNAKKAKVGKHEN